MRNKPGFTLTELLVTIAIMGVMFGLLVPVVERSLGGNRLAADAEIFRAKLEEIRLRAGSTQSGDESSTSFHRGTQPYDEVGYYAILLSGNDQFYSIVRLAYPVSGTHPGVCKPGTAIQHARAQGGVCFVERVNLSAGVTLSCPLCVNGSNHFLAFSVPAGQLSHVKLVNNVWQETVWTESSPIIRLSYNGKNAAVTVDPFTARVGIVYN